MEEIAGYAGSGKRLQAIWRRCRLRRRLQAMEEIAGYGGDCRLYEGRLQAMKEIAGYGGDCRL